MSLKFLSGPAISESEPSVTSDGSVKVLYIGGQGRSGSTLLGRLLGDIPGFVNVGEVRMIWAALAENRLCGCGEPIRQCPFWNAAIEHATVSAGRLDPEAILRTKRTMERLRNVPRMLCPVKTANQRRMIKHYRSSLAALYRSIRTISGAKVIVDGSKTPVYAYHLQGIKDLDLRVLHLVRDSRAVAYSRKKLDPTIHWKETHFQPVPPARVALEWTAKNLLTEMLTPNKVPSMFVRYEEAVSRPMSTIKRLADFMSEQLPDTALEFLSQPVISLGTHHTVTGNPDRFKSTIEIRPDCEWRDKMNPAQRAIVTVLTYPLLVKYGYSKGA
jgi:hypothetical protein